MRRSKRKLKWKIISLLSGLVLLLVGVVYLIIYSGMFQVQDIEISGSRFYDSEFLKTSLATEIIGQNKILALMGSENILFWSFGADRNLVLNQDKLPYLKGVSLTANVTGRRLVIRADERDLAGVFCLLKDKCFAFDDEGVVFSNAPSVEGSLILRVDDPNPRPIVFGRSFLPKLSWVNNLLKTVDIVKNSPFYVNKVVVKDLGVQEFEIKTSSETDFYFSFEFVPEDLEGVLSSINKKLDLEKVSYVDFRVPNRLYYK